MELCNRCGEDTEQDEFPTKDGTMFCGACYLAHHAASEGWTNDHIAGYAIALYAESTAWGICQEAGISREEFETELISFNSHMSLRRHPEYN